MSLLDSNCCSETVFYVAVEEVCTCGIIIEVFDDSDKISVDGILYHGCPQSCMPSLVEGLREVNENMMEVLLVLELLFTEYS